MKQAKSGWCGVVLVCGKCQKKIGGPSLTKTLRRRAGKGRKASMGVIEVKCLKLCPKNAVTVVDAHNPSEWLVVKPGEEEALMERLGFLSSPRA